MSTQIRTWTEHCNAEGEPLRWELAINDRPVPGGYIEKTDGGFEIHYPHLASKTLPTLDEAKRSLELAPPISAAGLKVEKAAADNSELISTAEAGEMLGVSRFRVNAMVASGVLPAAATTERSLSIAPLWNAKLPREPQKDPRANSQISSCSTLPPKSAFST